MADLGVLAYYYYSCPIELATKEILPVSFGLGLNTDRVYFDGKSGCVLASEDNC